MQKYYKIVSENYQQFWLKLHNIKYRTGMYISGRDWTRVLKFENPANSASGF